jgi:hypothetical protein
MPKKSSQAKKKISKESLEIKQTQLSVHRLVLLLGAVIFFVLFLIAYFYWQMEQMSVRLQSLEEPQGQYQGR